MAGFKNDVVYAEQGMRIGDRTVTTGEVASIQFSEPAAGTQLLINNTSNTTDSFASAIIKVAGSAADGPYLKFQRDVTAAFAIGINMDAYRSSTENRLIIRAAYSSSVSPESGTYLMYFDDDPGVGTGDYRCSFGTRFVSIVNEQGTGVTDLNIQSASGAGTDYLRINLQSRNSGDPYIEYSQGANGWSHGKDVTVGSTNGWVLANVADFQSRTAATDNTLVVSTAGEVTMPLTPAFLAYLAGTDTNATGDSTAFTLGSGNALTEVYDQNGDFVTTGTFTAPVTGKYNLECSIQLNNLGAAHANGSVYISTSNRNYYVNNSYNVGTARTGGGNPNIAALNGSCLADMDAMDTATVVITVADSTKTVGIGAAAFPISYFCGKLAC